MRWRVVWLGLLLLAGCQRVVVPGPLPPHADESVQRSAGYGLLVNLLEAESRVGALLSIRDFPPETAAVVEAIAADAGSGAAELRTLAGEPPAIECADEGLPVVEIEARNLIAARTSLALLTSRGSTGELELLLAQSQATEYVMALSAALLDLDRCAARRAVLERINQRFLAHHQALRERLDAGWSTE